MAATETAPIDEIRKVNDMIRDMRVAMLTTVLPDGSLRSRPMATQPQEFDGELWFFTDEGASKTIEIQRNPHVNLAFADPASNRYVSVSGRASIVHDPEKAAQLWTDDQKPWFPQGPADPKLALLRISVDFAEYWDRPASRMIQIFGFLKASITGKRYEPGETGRVDLGPHRPSPPPGEDLPKSEGSNYARYQGEERARHLHEE